jgi:hypothetical protein
MNLMSVRFSCRRVSGTTWPPGTFRSWRIVRTRMRASTASHARRRLWRFPPVPTVAARRLLHPGGRGLRARPFPQVAGHDGSAFPVVGLRPRLDHQDRVVVLDADFVEPERVGFVVGADAYFARNGSRPRSSNACSAARTRQSTSTPQVSPADYPMPRAPRDPGLMMGPHRDRI